MFDELSKAKRPLIIVGQGALTRGDGAAVLHAVSALAAAVGAFKDGWNGFNVLHTAAARVGGLDLGFLPATGGKDVAGIIAGAQSGEIKTVLLLGADEIDTSKLGKANVIYIGSHGDNGAHRADVILPAAAYTEKSAHLCQHRRPRAAHAARRGAEGRCARRLGDPARAVGLCRQDAAV